MLRFHDANSAFLYLYNAIHREGVETDSGIRVLNLGFRIENPLENEIKPEWRNWNKDYAEYEWQWYLSGNPYVTEIKKRAKIWDRMHGGDDFVNSNYGYQWGRNDQLAKTIQDLRENGENTRQAYISLFDGKEKHLYDHDTVCTLAVGFIIENGKLCMNVMMRSNDLWFGFCNDQYCFSKLQELVANELGLPVGWYYHHANDLHIYNPQRNRIKLA